jgi:hypothetical protein
MYREERRLVWYSGAEKSIIRFPRKEVIILKERNTWDSLPVSKKRFGITHKGKKIIVLRRSYCRTVFIQYYRIDHRRVGNFSAEVVLLRLEPGSYLLKSGQGGIG